MDGDRYDVVILGGGLAGSTLALQLKRRRPLIRVAVLERRLHPFPEAAFKVGESVAEVASYYLDQVVGLGDHIRTGQIRKMGLRVFAAYADNRDIGCRSEAGLSRFLASPTFQVDRGRLENELLTRCVDAGVAYQDEARVEGVSIANGEGVPHTIDVSTRSGPAQLTARWLVDATGRRALLKRKLDLEKTVPHECHAAWLRVADRVDVNDWCDRPDWRARIAEGERYASTNHLTGQGYWVWLIPLASGSTSIGVVADERFHPFAQLDSREKMLAWLRLHEPQCAEAIGRRSHLIQDFRVQHHFAVSSKQVFSSDRWCLTGEAGVFNDPLYSPGSDFIAVANTLITDLIARDLGGEDVRLRIQRYDSLFRGQFAASLRFFQGVYSVLGNPRVMMLKPVWDSAVYWSAASVVFTNGRLTDLAFVDRIAPDLERALQLNSRMQAVFVDWDRHDRSESGGGWVDGARLKFFTRLNRELLLKVRGDLEDKIRRDVDLLEALAAEIFRRISGMPPDARIDPYRFVLGDGATGAPESVGSCPKSLAEDLDLILPRAVRPAVGALAQVGGRQHP